MLTSRNRYTGPHPAVRGAIEVRSGGRCEFAGCLEAAVHTHHRKPRRAGGSRDVALNLPSNLLRLCLEHHEWIESNRTEAYELGLLLHANDDPEWTPVQTNHDELPVFLFRDGTISLFYGRGLDGPWS